MVWYKISFECSLQMGLTKSVDLNTFVDADAIRTVLITNGAFAVILLPCIRP